MKIQLVAKLLSEIKTEVLVLPVWENGQMDMVDERVKEFLKDDPEFGKKYENQLLYTPGQKILLIGLGKKEKFNFEICQNFAGTAVKSQLLKVKELAIVPPQTENLSLGQIIYALTLGIEIATHNPSLTYKSDKQENKLSSALILVEKNQKEYQEALKKGVVVAESINLARKLGDMPANEMTPTYFLTLVKKIAKENRLKIKVVNEKMAKKMGMGAFAGVSSGSDEPSYMIALQYLGNLRSKEKLGLIGKGLTFDSGGISIKPSSGMHEMKYDMSGAAVVLGIMQALSKLKLKTNVVGIMAVTENLPSGKSLKPGDILRSYSGKSVEVLNTDAEGRLILIDALTFAQKDFKATKLIDLATLTGAIVVSLGDFTTGVFSNNSEFAQNLIQIGENIGEKFWQFPLGEEYEEMIKSDIADVTNIGHGGSMPGAAGSITAAQFLEKVVDKDKIWIHLDIAGTAWDLKPKPFRGPGATGVGVKSLVELIEGEYAKC